MQIITFVLTSILSRFRSERGQDLIEYALLSALVATALITVIGIGLLTGAVNNMVTAISQCIDFQPGGCTTPFT